MVVAAPPGSALDAGDNARGGVLGLLVGVIAVAVRSGRRGWRIAATPCDAKGRSLGRAHRERVPDEVVAEARVATIVEAICTGTWPSGRRVAEGTVAFWHGDEGWGAIKAPDRSGVGFVHFSHIRDVEGYRELFADEQVEFEWADDFGQDGCQWRVAWVRPLSRESGEPLLP